MADISLLHRTASPVQGAEDIEFSVAWLLSRVGFGATTSELDHASVVGLDQFLDELLAPESWAVPDQGDPWFGLDLAVRATSPRDMLPAVMAWTDRMVSASQPVTEWLAWYWHGHLVSGYLGARTPLGLVNQIRLFRTMGGGRFPELLRAVTVDAAMLRYLDGDTSTGSNPNENYSRELLELFALGVGHYTEDDVRAGAAALTGWTRVRGSAEAVFRPARHDDTAHRYLGADGVNDVDGVIAAVVDHDACAPFVVSKLADAILGPGASFDRRAEANRFRADGMEVRPLVRRLIDLGLAGASTPIVMAPLPWTIAAVRSTDAELTPGVLQAALRGGGQAPFFPPNVSGWPAGEAWLTSSGTSTRLEASRAIADAADANGPAMLSAQTGDLAGLARSLGRPQGFSATTNDALRATGERGRTLLALALTAPDLVIA